jgi:hypothetical protein
MIADQNGEKSEFNETPIKNGKKEDPSKKPDKKIIKIKKNLWDPMAAFGFALGISIVHLSLSIVIIIVEKPDVDKASTFGQACQKEAEQLQSILLLYQIIHIVTFFACVFREMYSTLSG